MESLINKAHLLESWVVQTFHKEALAVFVIFCLMVFALAAMTAFWAFRSGEFSNMESAKFDLFEEGDEERANLVMGY